MSGREDRGPISPGLTGPAPRSGGRPARYAFRGAALRHVLQCACRTEAFASSNLRTEPCPCVAWPREFAADADRRLLVQTLLTRRGSKLERPEAVGRAICRTNPRREPASP